MIVWYYFLSFASVLFMISSFLFRNKKINTRYVVFCLLVVLYTLGDWLVSISVNVPMAVVGLKIMHLGSCFAPIANIFILSRFSDIKLNRYLKIALISLASLTYGCILTIGYEDWYYKSVVIVRTKDQSFLIKQYGSAHIIFYVLMITYMIVTLGLLIQAYRKRTRIAFREVLGFGILSVSITLAYLITRVVDLPIELTNLGFLIATIYITRAYDKLNMFDLSTNIANSVAQANENGYIVFDRKRRYINANPLIKEVFPEINDWLLENRPTETDSDFYHEIIEWFYENSQGKHKSLEHDGKYYEFSIRAVTRGKNFNKVGYLLEAIDRTADHRYTVTIQQYGDRLAREVAQKTARIEHIKNMMVLGMSAMVESRDNSTGGHIRRTSKVVSVFAKELMKSKDNPGLSDEFLEMVERAAPMHDLGKIAVKDAILQKNGKFTDEEYAEMKKHSAEGARIVNEILTDVEDDRFVEIAKNVAHYHHEKWNGRGYPDGLAGEQIPIEARIMALADVFDALVSKRCYKEAFDYDKAFDIIKNDIGEHFDPVLGKVFLTCRPQLEKLYNEINTSS